MRLDEILAESVTFGVGRLEDHNGKKYYTDPFSKKVRERCWVCNGTGKEENRAYNHPNTGEHYPATSHPCGMCKGEGEIDEWKSDAQEFNVSNTNAMEIQRMIGLDPDYSGVIKKEDFPQFRRTLIKLKNGDISSHTEEPSVDQGVMKAYKDDNGIDKIGRGPKIYNGGRTNSQIERYIDSLLSLIDFAQKNDCDVTWA